MKKIFKVTMICCVLFAMCFLSFYFLNTSKRNNSANIDDKIKTIKQKLLAFTDNNKDKVGLFYCDLKTGKSININGDKRFVAASTIKVPLNMLLYNMADKKEISLDTKIQYDNETDYEEGTGILDEDTLKDPIPYKTLSKVSIENSDNIATNMITRTLGTDKIYTYYEKVTNHKFEKGENYIDANDLGKFFKILYNNPNHNKYYDKLIYYMKNTEFHDRIDKYIPRKRVAHKIGSYDSYINDAAIVYAKNPYILIVLTNEVNHSDEFIAKLSKIIYSEIERKT